MIVDAQVNIGGSRAAVWAAISDIKNAAQIITGIVSIEMVNKPAHGLAGLRWRETRMMFGQPATVEKWITEAVENEFYKTRAESDGYIFLTTNRISGGANGATLATAHESLPQSL
ncbi:MAG TPA: SRPBCC family protein, partial [Pseudoduganella sp.]